MTPQELAQFCREQLGVEAERSGGIFYSKPELLKRGDVYLMGYNPGGDSGPPISEELDNHFAKSVSDYEQIWQHRSGTNDDGTLRHRDVERSTRYQRGLKEFTALLGYQPGQIFMTNLIFFQSHDGKGVKYKQDSETCWPIHEKMLSIVKPKIIVAVGNDNAGSAYTKLLQQKRHKIDPSSKVVKEANHGKYRLKGFRFSEDNRDVMVLGLPHFSYYNVKPNQDLLKQFINDLAR